MTAVSKRSRTYWTRRARQLEAAQHRRGTAFLREVERQHRIAMQAVEADILRWYSRIAVNNEISLADAKRLLSRSELAEFKWTLGEYIRYGEQNAIDGQWIRQLENASARQHITWLEAQKMQMRQHAEALYQQYGDGTDALMRGTLQDSYYKTAFDVHKARGEGQSILQMDDRMLDAAIDKPWTLDGKTFSGRIWGDKQALIRKMETGLAQAAIRGEPPDKLIDDLMRDFDVSLSHAKRLVYTELSYFSAEGKRASYIALGVTKYEIVATLDAKTSEICQGKDGEVHDVADFVPGITANPFHPHCRSSTAPLLDDTDQSGEERIARGADGKTYHVPADMTYPDWQKIFVQREDGAPESKLHKQVKRAIMQKKAFVKAKTIAEAEAFARDTLGVPHCSYKGVDIETANEWNRGLADSFDRFPELRANFGFVGECHERNGMIREALERMYVEKLTEQFPQYPRSELMTIIKKQVKKDMKGLAVSRRTYAQSFPLGDSLMRPFAGVSVNRDFGKDSVRFIESLRGDVLDGFHPIGCDTIRSVLDHEVGHQLDGLLSLRNHPDVISLYTARTKDQIGAALSRYVVNNSGDDIAEMIAEGWAEYCNNESPREMAQAIADIIEREYAKWKQKKT